MNQTSTLTANLARAQEHTVFHAPFAWDRVIHDLSSSVHATVRCAENAVADGNLDGAKSFEEWAVASAVAVAHIARRMVR